MFDRTGQRLVWGSSRNGRSRSELNLFIADWRDTYTMKIRNEIKVPTFLLLRHTKIV